LTISCVQNKKDDYIDLSSKGVKVKRFNVLYPCVLNELEFINLSSSDSIAISHGEIIKNNNNEYTAIIEKIEDVEISIISRHGDIFKSSFKVRRLPYPTAYIDGKYSNSGVVELKRIENIEIYSRVEGFSYDVKYEITNFSILRIDMRGFKSEIIVDKADLTSNNTQQFLQETKRGDLLIFKNITAKNDCEDFEKILNSIVIDVI
jgi:hypothetical protein